MRGPTIYHLYPGHLNLYGDRGNIIALQQRARWHGLETEVVAVQPGSRVDFAACDLLFMGGGDETAQKMACRHLKEHRHALLDCINRGMVILAIGSSHQLLGRYYTAASGEQYPGLELLNFYTEAGTVRMIGDIVTRCDFLRVPHTLVGFENHAGRTYLGKGVRPLGTVLRGYGNNGADRTEGVLYRNVAGSYLHGSLLPKNPWLADWLLQRALRYRGIACRLQELDDSMENEAHRFILKRCLSPFYRRPTPGL